MKEINDVKKEEIIVKLDDRRVRRTKKLLKNSLAALLMEKNIKNISIKELVDLADINRGTFYLHYCDIYDLLEQIEKEMLDELEDMSSKFAYSELNNSPRIFIEQVFQYIADNQEFCRMLLGPYGDMAFVEKIKLMVTEKCFHNLIQNSKASDRQSYEYYAAFTISGSVGLLQNWIETGMKISVSELADLADPLIVAGMEKMSKY